jgi:hypothetical protein
MDKLTSSEKKFLKILEFNNQIAYDTVMEYLEDEYEVCDLQTAIYYSTLRLGKAAFIIKTIPESLKE